MPVPSGAEVWKNPVVIDTFARRHYQKDLDFHHYPHALLTTEILEALAAAAIDHGVNLDEDQLKPAGLYHDAGTDLWVPYSSFSTKEELAADIAARDLRMLGTPKPVIEANTTAIKSTSHTEHCTTDLARALRQADLISGGVLAHPVIFINGTYRLYKEGRSLKEQPVTPPSYADKLIKELVEFGIDNHEVMLAYVEEDIALGDHQRDTDTGESLFNRYAAVNVDLLRPNRLESFLHDHLGDVVGYEPIGMGPTDLFAS